MKICGIYKITSPDGKIYIGQSVDIMNRWKIYRNLKCNSQKRIYNSLKKHSPGNHKFEIILQCDRAELNHLEVYYINLYNTFNSCFGLNLTSGGGSAKLSEETKAKISLAKKGKPHTEKAKVAHLGREENPEATKKRSEMLKGRKLSMETRVKMSKSRMGPKHHMFGKRHRNRLG